MAAVPNIRGTNSARCIFLVECGAAVRVFCGVGFGRLGCLFVPGFDFMDDSYDDEWVEYEHPNGYVAYECHCYNANGYVQKECVDGI